MGNRANLVLVDRDGWQLRYSHWAGCRILDALIAGPGLAERYIRAQVDLTPARQASAQTLCLECPAHSAPPARCRSSSVKAMGAPKRPLAMARPVEAQVASTPAGSGL